MNALLRLTLAHVTTERLSKAFSGFLNGLFELIFSLLLRHNDDMLIGHLDGSWWYNLAHYLFQLKVLLSFDLLNFGGDLFFGCFLKCLFFLTGLKLCFLLFGLLSLDFLFGKFFLNLIFGFLGFGLYLNDFLLFALLLNEFSGGINLLLGLGEGRVNLCGLLFSCLFLDLRHRFGLWCGRLGIYHQVLVKFIFFFVFLLGLDWWGRRWSQERCCFKML